MPKAKTKADPLAALVDEYGRLSGELAPIKPKLRRLDAVAKLLRASVPEKVKPEESATLAGIQYEAILGPREERTVIAANAAVYKKLGKDGFLEVAGVTLKALEEHVHPLVVAELTHKERTGSRAIDVRAKAQAKAA